MSSSVYSPRTTVRRACRFPGPGSQIQFSVSNIEEVYAMLIATVFEADESESSRQDILAGWLLRPCTSSERSCTEFCPWSATSEDEPVSAWCVWICRSRPPRGPSSSGDVGAYRCCIWRYREEVWRYCCNNRCELLPEHRRRTSRNHSQWICGCVEEPVCGIRMNGRYHRRACWNLESNRWWPPDSSRSWRSWCRLRSNWQNRWGFLSQASAGADDDSLCLGWVHSQGVTFEPVAKLKNCYWVVIMERDVQLCVVRVLHGCGWRRRMWSHWWSVRHKGWTGKARERNPAVPQTRRQMEPIVDHRPSRTGTTQPGKTRYNPARDRGFRKWTPVYAGEYRSQSYRKRQRDPEGSGCSGISRLRQRSLRRRRRAVSVEWPRR